MTFFEAAPNLIAGALIARGHWFNNAVGFGPRGQLCYFWTPSIRPSEERYVSGTYTLTRDDMNADDWKVIGSKQEVSK